MYVPNYVPEPLEVPDNVTEQPYGVRLQYVRRVSILHFASLLLVGAIAYSGVPMLALPMAAAFLGGFVLLLCLLRIAIRGSKVEAMVSAGFLPVLLAFLGMVVHGVESRGLPAWTVILGPGFALIYTLLCGRDFSFVGQYLLSLIGSSVAIATLADFAPLSREQAVFALAANAGYLSYYVYDLASLLARRRLGEELGAVVDLYRDILNVFGYLVRMVRHWRRHKIWVAR
jgi:hypothetical protein